MTKIVSVEARTLRVPLETATAFSNRLVEARYYTLVRVTGDDGVSGIGFCYPGSAAGELATIAVRDLLAPVVVGQDAHRVEGIWTDSYQETLLHGRAGTVMRALSAIDIALWDRNARAAELPLWKFLGAAYADRVPAYASGGYYLDGKGPEDLADEMRSYVEAGFDAVKMKIGRLDPGADAERLAAVREAVGPDVLVMLDANNAWSDLPTALRSMAQWEPYDPYWIEEPFSPDDIENHARLSARTSILVATGEIEAGRWRHKQLLDEQAAAILQTDAAVCGGITEFRRIAATASSYGVTLCPHWFHDLHVHLVASTPNARFVEYFPDDKVLNFRRVVSRQLQVEDGQLLLPEGPGLGFDLDPDAVEALSIDPWA
jgi:L-alanine-DL-glutamate epimerase-like enolase superfamily enzyme